MTQEPAPQPPEPKTTNRLRRALFWLRAVFVVCLLPLVFCAAAAVMMIDRDITAPTWIKTRVEQRAQDLLAGSTLEFGAITVRIARDLHPTVRLVDTRLIDHDGTLVARVPVVEGLMSPRGLILQQEVLMQQVRLIGAQVDLRRTTAGDVSFALTPDGGDLGRAETLPALLDQFDALFERPALEALEVVRADGLVVNFDDARAGRKWVVDGSRAVLDLRGGQTQIDGNFDLRAGRPEVTSVSLSYQSPRGSRAAQLALNLTNVVGSDIAAQSPALAWLRDVDAPMTATLRTQLDAAGALGPLNAAFEIGQGVFQPNAATDPVAFDAAKAYFTYDPLRDRISFSQVSLQTGWGQLSASGDAYLREFRDGLPRALLAQFRLQDVVVNPPGYFETAPEIADVSIDLRARFDPFEVEIGQIVALDGDSRLTAQGAVAATDAGWEIALDTQIDKITPERFAAFWPAPMKPRSRAWFAANLRDGHLANLAAGLRIRPQDPPQFAIGFEFVDTTMQLLKSLPPMQAASGFGQIAENAFVVSLDKGTVQAPVGGPLALDGTSLTLADTRLDPSPAVLDLQIAGSLTATLSVLNQPPFGFMDKANRPVDIAQAQALTRGQVRWPLMPAPPPEAITFDMTAQLRDVRSATLIPDRQFVSPLLTVTANRQGINIAGPMRIGQARGVGAWDQRFGDPALPGSRVLAQVDLSQEFLDEFGILLPDGTIAGAGRGELALSFQEAAPPAFALTSDLVGLRVAVPAIGWTKGANTQGNLRIEGTLAAVPTIERLEIGGGGLRAAGRVDLNDVGGLAAARFATVQVGNWLNAPVTLTGRGRGAPLGVAIGGGTLDLRGAPFGGGQNQSGPIEIALDRLQVSEGIALTDFRGSFRADDGFRGDFQGRLNGAADVQGTVAPRDGRSAVRLRSDDAGAVLQAAGITPNARGGTFDLTLLPAGGAGTFDGTLDIDRLRIQDAPAMAALLDAVSVVGLLQQLDGQGLAFEEVDARFRLTPSQVIVSEASAVGPGLGLSLDGVYALASKDVDFQGVISPFYLVNSIGSFLTRRGEGLIGFNYTIGGTSDAPQIGVNPLSAFTPGMFREIFRRPAPEIDE